MEEPITFDVWGVVRSGHAREIADWLVLAEHEDAREATKRALRRAKAGTPMRIATRRAYDDALVLRERLAPWCRDLRIVQGRYALDGTLTRCERHDVLYARGFACSVCRNLHAPGGRLLRDGRRLEIASLAGPVAVPRAAFAVLLPAFSEAECQAAAAHVPALLERDCRYVCCVGPLSPTLEFAVDVTIVERGGLDVMTTAHPEDLDDALWFFLYCTNDAWSPTSLALVALVGDHPQVVDRLVAAIDR